MRFMMLMIPKGYESAKADAMPDPKAIEKMMKYNEELKNAGVLLSLDGLHPPATGARVSYSGGKPQVTDGPFPETKEVLGGYWMINVKSRAEAIEWAKKVPAANNEVVEVRQVFEMTEFPEDIQKAAAKIMQRNPIVWTEIPVKDIERARKFYETAFGFAISPAMPFGDHKMAFLPMDPKGPGSGGALFQGGTKPSQEGVTIYLSVKSINPALEAIAKAGGKMLIPRTDIGQYGFFAHFEDSEGNRVGIHEMPVGAPCQQ